MKKALGGNMGSGWHSVWGRSAGRGWWVAIKVWQEGKEGLKCLIAQGVRPAYPPPPPLSPLA